MTTSMRTPTDLRFRRTAVILSLALAAGCSPEKVLGEAELPADTPDPRAVQTPAGAAAAHRGAVAEFRRAFGDERRSFISTGGLLTDELRAEDVGSPLGSVGADMPVDSRTLPEAQSDGTTPLSTPYGSLQAVRGLASQARGLLRDFAPDSLRPLIGHLHALQGYSEIFLAELFCSGVPLSTLDYHGDYTLKPGSSSAEIYEHAIVLFDSALALAGDSTRVLDLARVGKARALANLGRYADAAAVAADVADDFRYAFTFVNQPDGRNFAYYRLGANRPPIMADAEGINGLDYISSGDPRTAATPVGVTSRGVTRYQPDKYAATGDSPVVLASGLEARLIEAEAELAAGGPAWLATLNALRTDGTFTVTPDPLDPAQADTTWHAGSGDTEGLAPLEDPGTPEARVDLLFRERAFWLFLTGHRQGDLRRLVRQYGRLAEQVYPTGAYEGAGGRFGVHVTVPVPYAERQYNPLFGGCLSRGA